MVSNKMLLHIPQRLKEIFATPDHMLFAGKSIIAVGEPFQLPPIMASLIFADYQKELLNFCHPWKEFTMIKLTEIIRQKDDRILLSSSTESELVNVQMKMFSCYAAVKYHWIVQTIQVMHCMYGVKMVQLTLTMYSN